MEFTQKQQEGRELLSSIYAKSWENEKFKRALIDNPIETLNKFTGKVASFPEDKKLVVVDQSNPNEIYLNIPAKPDYENIELNDEQLEMVSGGELFIGGTILFVAVAWAGLESSGTIDTVDWL